MIPQIIHYCWFGKNQIPEKMEKCIESWKKFCPEYKIIRWDETNFDININTFVKTAYEKGKWAFVTDYARLWIIYHYGGFYLDTDVELIKTLDSLRYNKVYFGCEGEEYVNTGVGFGAEPNCEIVIENMKIYEKMNVIDSSVDFSVMPCPYYTTELLKEKGVQFPIRTVQKCDNVTIYPNDYFNPYDWASKKLKITSNTYSIHHYTASWMTIKQKRGVIEQHYYKIYSNKYGKRFADIWSYFYWCRKENGGVGIWKTIIQRILKKGK